MFKKIIIAYDITKGISKTLIQDLGFYGLFVVISGGPLFFLMLVLALIFTGGDL